MGWVNDIGGDSGKYIDTFYMYELEHVFHKIVSHPKVRLGRKLFSRALK